MIASTPPETTSKFTPEQCQLLGRVYAMILRWNTEDDLLRAQQASQSPSFNLGVQDSAAFAEINQDKE
jgi:hypothetical protein